MTDAVASNAVSGARLPRAAFAWPSYEGWRAFALAAPLILLLVASFVAPIAGLLARAFYDPTIANALPQTMTALAKNPTDAVPDDAVFAALAADLAHDQAQGNVSELAKSVNARLPGARSQILRAARLASSGANTKSAFLSALPFWGDVRAWSTIRGGARRLTSFYLLSALDLQWDERGLGFVDPQEAVFLRVFARTFFLAAVVTIATLALGFPLAWLICNAPARWSKILLVLVLLPLWTSILVRTAAWTVLLQRHGLVNDLLIWLGVVNERLELMYSRVGLIVAMTQIQLPFTTLPIYSVMRSINPSQLRAAYSLGARPATAFLRVYLPQTMPGIMAGCLLTFILCLGYFITPALIGGPADQLISNFIANYVNVDLNWEMAAALSFLLITATLLLCLVFARFLGLDRLKLT